MRTLGLLGLVVGLLVFSLGLLMSLVPLAHVSKPVLAGGFTVVIALLWITGIVRFWIPALIPILYPIFGILDIKEVWRSYTNPLIFFFLSGMLIAQAAQEVGLDKRIALRVIGKIGFSPAKLVLGFMITGALLSLGTSNTAIALLLTPIATAVAQDRSIMNNLSKKEYQGFSRALLIGVAYSVSLGGIGTLIGTPPNVILAGVAQKNLKLNVDFVRWLAVGLPVTILFLPIAWGLLIRFFKVGGKLDVGKEAIELPLKTLGQIKKEEVYIIILFLITVGLWAFGESVGKYKDVIQRNFFIYTAMIVGFLLSVRDKSDKSLLPIRSFKKVGLDIIALFGGGLAISQSFQSTGLAKTIASNLVMLAETPSVIMVAIVCFVTVFMSEVLSNTAHTALMLPILASTAQAMSINPLLLMVPATISASCGFMLPSATPPNAIVMREELVQPKDMRVVGLIMNFVGIIIVSVVSYITIVILKVF